MASKLGELQRRGACRHPVFAVAVCPPQFDSVPPHAGAEHFSTMFGLPDVFTGCSVVGRVVLRCAEFDVAFKNAAGLHADFIASAMLTFMIESYPYRLKGLPFGTRLIHVLFCVGVVLGALTPTPG